MKTTEQLLNEITALMADTWLAACERRVIAPALAWHSYMVLDTRENARLFGPASGDEEPRRGTCPAEMTCFRVSKFPAK